MAIDKSFYQAPDGDNYDEEEVLVSTDMTVVVDDGTTPAVEFEDGSVEIQLEPGPEKNELMRVPFDANLAEFLSEDDLNEIATDIMEMVDSDMDSRKEWAETFVEGLEVLGFKYEQRTDPWDDACGVYSTVLAEAAIRFQAETMSETFPAAGPVKTKILGDPTKLKEEAAERVRNHMNYALTEQMVEYRSEHERLLYSLGLAGSAFKKAYFDPNLGRQVAMYVSAEDVVVPYGASHIETAERVTHVMRKTQLEVAKLQAAGFYRKVELGEPQAFHTDIEKKKAEESGFELNEDNRHALYEVHLEYELRGDYAEWDAEGESSAKPYVITIDKGTNEVMSIRRNWDPEDSLRLKRQHFVHYVYVPGFGFYGLGLIHIIGGYARAGTSLIRQLVDAGTLSNLPGGLKARGMRVTEDEAPIRPGEWRDIDVPSGSIRDNIMPLPYKEPSNTLLNLLERITNEGRRLGAISDMNISDMSANAPVGTTLALLERTLKPMAAVQARVHYAMKQEFKLLKALMADYASPVYEYQPESGSVMARQQDYQMVDVIPVSDPNSSTMAQRVVQHQAVLQMSEQAPHIYDMPQLHRQMMEVLGIKNAEKIVPLDEDLTPKDPVSENMAALVGKPMKAFIYQDHDAHIRAHQAFMQDPMIAQAIGQNPQANQIMAALQAHIAEHLGYAYRNQIQQKLGVPLPPPDEPLPEDIEVLLAQLVADAGVQITQAHQQQAAQAEAQQKAQDPEYQLRMAEAQTKAAEVQRKARKDQWDYQLRGDEQERKRAKDLVDAELQLEEIAEDRRETDLEAQRAGAELANQRTELDRRTTIELLDKLAQYTQSGKDTTQKKE